MNGQRAGTWFPGNWRGLLRASFVRWCGSHWFGSSLLARLVRGTFWTVFGTCLARVMGLLASVLLARFLGQKAFGELATIQSTAGLFGTLAGLGIGITATKYVAEFRQVDPDRCGRVIGLCLSTGLAGGALGGLALLLFGDWLAIHTLAAGHLAPLLRWSAGLVVFGALQGTYLGCLAGFEAFKQTAWVNGVASFIGLPLVILATLAGGLEGAVLGSVLQSAIGCLCGHAALIKQAAKAKVKLSFAIGCQEWGLLWRFTLPAFCSCAVATPAGWLTRTFLVNQSGGYSDMAVFGAANQWMNFVTFLPWMMGGVLVPIFSELYAAKRRTEFVRLLRYNLLLNAGVALALAIPLGVFAHRILRLYGEGFSEGVLIFDLAMMAAFFNAFNGLFSRAMQAAGKAWMDLSSNAVWAGVALGASWLLIGRYHGAGFAAAHALAALAWGLWQWVLVNRVLMTLRGNIPGETKAALATSAESLIGPAR
jgi:O-antigen/teichoic acid export membrane protein